jgi:hypothetical protein
MYDGGVLEFFSSDQRALLAGITACPEDDAPTCIGRPIGCWRCSGGTGRWSLASASS